jgi:hypothetical protein
MLILFDNGTPAPLRHALSGHRVVEAIEKGWDRLVNGELIAAAEQAGFDVLLTTDKNMRYSKTSKAVRSLLLFSATSNGRFCATTWTVLLLPWIVQHQAVTPKWKFP